MSVIVEFCLEGDDGSNGVADRVRKYLYKHERANLNIVNINKGKV